MRWRSWHRTSPSRPPPRAGASPTRRDASPAEPLSWLDEDLDAWEEGLAGFDGLVASSFAGPWTLAASVELRSGERALRDPGACRDLAAALAHAVVDHVEEVRRRLPGARVSVWIDEPAMPEVLLGAIPTQSGRGRYAAIDEPVVEASLRAVVDALQGAGAGAVVHCCGARPPYDLFVRSGFDAVSADLTLHDQHDDDAVGELVEAGRRLVAGVVPAIHGPLSEVGATVGVVRDLGHRLGHSPEAFAGSVLVSPTCGLAGASPGHAREVIALLRAAGRALREEEGGGRGDR